MVLLETMPSPQARRIAPTISEDIKKKIQIAVKSKEKRQGVKKEIHDDIVRMLYYNIGYYCYIFFNSKLMNLIKWYKVKKL